MLPGLDNSWQVLQDSCAWPGKQKTPRSRLGTQGERTSAVPPEFGQAKGLPALVFP